LNMLALKPMWRCRGVLMTPGCREKALTLLPSHLEQRGACCWGSVRVMWVYVWWVGVVGGSARWGWEVGVHRRHCQRSQGRRLALRGAAGQARQVAGRYSQRVQTRSPPLFQQPCAAGSPGRAQCRQWPRPARARRSPSGCPHQPHTLRRPQRPPLGQLLCEEDVAQLGLAVRAPRAVPAGRGGAGRRGTEQPGEIGPGLPGAPASP
jgi:hypothetical protein